MKCPPFEQLVDYIAGDLTPLDQVAVEEHYFGCERCTHRLEAVQGLADGVAAAVRRGRVGVPVTPRELARAVRDGLAIRRYDIAPGESVACTIAPDDDLVAVCLAGSFPASATRLEIETEDLHDGAISGQRAVPVAVGDGQVVLLFTGDAVRAFPRSRWTMHLRDGDERFGPFVMDHTPWDQLSHR